MTRHERLRLGAGRDRDGERDTESDPAAVSSLPPSPVSESLAEAFVSGPLPHEVGPFAPLPDSKPEANRHRFFVLNELRGRLRISPARRIA